MPDDDYYTPPGWDLDGPWEQGNDTSLNDIASEMGWTDWRDVINFEGGYDREDVRPGIYESAYEAILEAYNQGILDYVSIIYDGEDDVWYIIVDY
jgi:hypothetical protein